MSRGLGDGLCYSPLGGAKIAAPGSSVLVRRRVFPHDAADLRRGHLACGVAAPVRPPRVLDARALMSTELAAVACCGAPKRIDTHEPLPLDPDVAARMHAIVEQTDRAAGVA